ncbi:hypothetical protein SRABI83_03993 [Arthrobacter sp. Bi83]|nr:hypothetical protein SRABI83_03993 [Arthrobacter sp. Bi83]
MTNDLRDTELLDPAAAGTAVGHGLSGTTTAGNADAMSATKESLEDYTLRFAPRSYRKWSAGVVATSALGGIAYLADFSIGANIGIAYGTVNAIFGIRWLITRRGTTSTWTSLRAAQDLDITAPWSPT